MFKIWKNLIILQKKDIMSTSISFEKFTNNYKPKNRQSNGGSLCFHGHWFGSPYDNYHELESVEYIKTSNKVVLTFNEGETLTLINPSNILEYKDKVTIESADYICWKWYSYGEPKIDTNLYFIEIIRENNVLIPKSNIDRYKPTFNDLNIKEPAVLWA